VATSGLPSGEKLPRQRERTRDVLGLRGLVTTSEQDDDLQPALDEVDPVAGPVVNLHLRDALDDGAQSPRFPASALSMRAWMRRAALRSRSAEKQVSKASVVRTVHMP
jgi:hypothetical protein